MQKDLKGGYQLISLGMLPIAQITFIDVELLKTTKRIVLTGISIDGKAQLPDKTVDVEYDGTDIKLKNVYGYDLVIDSLDINDGNVSVFETQTSGGTKLYKHHIVLNEDDTIDIISPVSSQILTDTALFTSNAVLINADLGSKQMNGIAIVGYSLITEYQDQLSTYSSMPDDFVSDTVTEL